MGAFVFFFPITVMQIFMWDCFVCLFVLGIDLQAYLGVQCLQNLYKSTPVCPLLRMQQQDAGV